MRQSTANLCSLYLADKGLYVWSPGLKKAGVPTYSWRLGEFKPWYKDKAFPSYFNLDPSERHKEAFEDPGAMEGMEALERIQPLGLAASRLKKMLDSPDVRYIEARSYELYYSGQASVVNQPVYLKTKIHLNSGHTLRFYFNYTVPYALGIQKLKNFLKKQIIELSCS